MTSQPPTLTIDGFYREGLKQQYNVATVSVELEAHENVPVDKSIVDSLAKILII